MNIQSLPSARLNLNASRPVLDHTTPSTVNKPAFPSASDKVAKDITHNRYKIVDTNGDGKITVAYKFIDLSNPEHAWRKKGGATEFSEGRKKAFRDSIRAWEDVTKVTFIENGKGADASILVHGNPGVGGVANLPVGDTSSMSIAIGVDEKGLPLNSSMIHEIGHSLGLEHPQGHYPENNKTHTAMSYTTHWLERPDEKGLRWSASTATPMMGDIAGVQDLYGANHNTRKGNTTYGFNANAGRDYYSLASSRDLAAFCVWDNGGNDTLDFSGYGQDQNINLNAESLSDVGDRKGNVSIAKGVVVENAIGGSGHDVLTGNQVGNRMTGEAGGDILYGGGGADTFVYNRASDSPPQNPDMLNDFVSGVDKIDLSRVLKDAEISKPIFTGVLTDQIGTLSGRKGELLLDYEKGINMHRLTLDVSGNNKSVLMILSKNPIKPNDILINEGSQLPTAPTRLTGGAGADKLTGNAGANIFNYDAISDSPYHNADVLMDFTTGKDKIDLSTLSEKAQVSLNHVKYYTGRIGDTLVEYHPATKKYYLAVDMTGNRRSDFLIKSLKPINSQDVIGLNRLNDGHG
ncbi:M10 family metallopeptidase C-terminal domain-containing protein [Pseudomonas sp. Leaf59]|uniref:M10 family metallopeptidase C-terminal domain-containing protein n=1 Tax=Pseudomonas sp. Leaf59 TaxID=2876556 RepID=UPI001E658B33|nr:M10 family metallopeptidase C-terminal domain-containing protein [Pseudomonas sp. Leaf59]